VVRSFIEIFFISIGKLYRAMTSATSRRPMCLKRLVGLRDIPKDCGAQYMSTVTRSIIFKRIKQC